MNKFTTFNYHFTKAWKPELHSMYETLYFFCPLKNEASRTEKWTPATWKTRQQSQRVSHRNVFIHLQGWLCLSSVGGGEGAQIYVYGPQTKRRVATWTRNSSAESTDGLWAGGIANSTTTPIFKVHWVYCSVRTATYGSRKSWVSLLVLSVVLLMA